eukprot:TRINITY_DN1047_c0_g4_i2.p1 TRINITY_DN1047_c0_g4~~TRINITY_DN1047_c0_g4_i2.p1  ORF type:complete len:352 (+),score=160.21 TRINITY_DN1047_c0_g4_i2:379-1434(+)
MILDSAEKPLDGNRWWLSAEDPWQALACCFELKNIFEYSKHSPATTYISNLPVHMDGSCNGLQHYAAMGGDETGGRLVNILPGPKPGDIYSGVAELVSEKVARDAARGDPIALLTHGKVSRKIVKQTVMTSVYGVTLVGARLQIQNALKDKGEVSEDDIFKISMYLTKLTFDALKEMFLGAKSIMEWLADCAKAIAKTNKAVCWTTPLGLPVVQPYRKPGKKQLIKTLVQTVVLLDEADDLPVSTARQTSAFPPNFVHSLDSTHMMLTAMACKEAGITYGSVHDSFWTHAGTIEKMSEILGQEFYNLHSQPILEQLNENFKIKYPNVILPPIPKRGNMDLALVLQSPYFFH